MLKLFEVLISSFAAVVGEAFRSQLKGFGRRLTHFALLGSWERMTNQDLWRIVAHRSN